MPAATRTFRFPDNSLNVCGRVCMSIDKMSVHSSPHVPIIRYQPLRKPDRHTNSKVNAPLQHLGETATGTDAVATGWGAKHYSFQTTPTSLDCRARKFLQTVFALWVVLGNCELFVVRIPREVMKYNLVSPIKIIDRQKSKNIYCSTYSNTSGVNKSWHYTI